MNKKYLLLSLIAFTVLYFGALDAKLFSSRSASQTAAVGNSGQTANGVSYPVTAEAPSAAAKTNSSIRTQTPSGFLKTIESDAFSPDIKVADADMPPSLPSPQSYIIEFTERPLAVRYAELKSQAKAGSTLQSAATIKLALAQQKALIVKQQDAFLNALPYALKAQNPSLTGKRSKRFSAVLNAAVLNMNRAEAASLFSLSTIRRYGIKKVEPVQTVRALLMDSVPLINAPKVWDGTFAGTATASATSTSTAITGKGITIAIIDTGVDYTNPDLGNGCFDPGKAPACKVANGYDFVNDDTDPKDDMGHGTHVAAIAAGNGALKGVAPDAAIYAYKVLDNNGSGSSANIIAGLEAAADPNGDGDVSDHLDVASLSLGGPGNPDDEMSAAVDNAVAAGVVVTVAAGNSGPGAQTIGSPGAARNAITVAATDKSDNLASFSSRGPVAWTSSGSAKEYLVKPDVAAPGVNICAADAVLFPYARAFPQGDQNCNKDDKHVAISGTSMATPHVAGLTALLLQLHHDWSPAEIKAVIKDTTLTLTQYPKATDVGSGRIDALKAAKSPRPPIAQLAPLGRVTGSINIIGTATAQHFARYTLSYSLGENPALFTDLYSGEQSILNGILARSFDTTALDEGFYTVKLSVTDTLGNKSEDVGLLEVNNISISNPLTNDIYKPGKAIAISGSIVGHPSRFTVEYIQDNGSNSASNHNWSTNGITLNSGTNDILATWDTSSITSNGFYSIRVSAYYGGHVASEFIHNIYFDTNLHIGWPVHIDFDYSKDELPLSKLSDARYVQLSSNHTVGKMGALSSSEIRQTQDATNNWKYDWAGDLPVVVDDLYNDGEKEIIIARGGNPPKIQVYKNDGTLLWSKPFGSELPGGNVTIPLVGDINNDGYDDIVIHNFNINQNLSDLYAFSHDGSLLWRSSVPKDYNPTMLMADLDHNGKKEIVVQGTDANLEVMYIVNGKNGNIINQWNLPNSHWTGSIPPSPSVGHFENNGNLDIVSISPTAKAGYNEDTKQWVNEDALFIHRKDGSVLPGFPIYLPGGIPSSPVVGDINGDGRDDIVVGLTYASDHFPDSNYGGLYAIDGTGKIMDGWPVLKGYNFWSTPSLADVNGDGRLDIAASRLGGYTYVFNYRGEVLLGWPQKTCFNDYYGSLMVDLNNDSKTDVITTDGNGVYGDCRGEGKGGVYGWSYNGDTLRGFPKVTEIGTEAPAVISDVEGNGKLNLIASSGWDTGDHFDGKSRGSLYVWDINSGYASTSLFWPTFKHDNQHTGCFGCFNASTSPVIIHPPVIQSVTGPSVIIAGDKAYAWTMLATDPDGSSFNYQVDWGDNSQTTGVKKYAEASSTQTVIFTRNFPRVGVFKPLFKLTDEDGLVATASPITINASDKLPTVKVYPLKDEVWALGEEHRVDYKLTNWASSSPVSVYLDQYDTAGNFATSAPLTPKSPLAVSGLNQFTVSLSSTTPLNGKNTIRVCGGACGPDDPSDSAANFFAIVKNTLSKETKIKVTDSSLTLVYDENKQEAVLRADFDVTVSAGLASLKIPQWGFQFRAMDGDPGHSMAAAGNVIRTTAAKNSLTGEYIVPLGEEALFKITAPFNPKIMFAGSYSVDLPVVFLFQGGDEKGGGILRKDLFEKPTNVVTIMGEQSPYIYSINPSDADFGELVTITGVRFLADGNKVNLGKASFSAPSSNSGTTISFKPRDVGGATSGWQFIYVTNPKMGEEGGRSNLFYIHLK